MDITAVIPARLGSSRVEKKVLLPFGKNDTLLSWKIKQIKKILPNNKIYVSSESNEILNIAKNLGVMCHERNPYLSDGHKASFSEVVYGIISEIEAEHIAWSTVVCPLMDEKDFDKCFKTYKNVISNNSYDSLVGVNLIKEYFWDEKKPLNYDATKNHTISQDLPNWYRVTNSIYIAPKKTILKEKYLLGKKVKLEILPKYAGIDIDDWYDYELAVNMLKTKNKY